MFIGAHLMFYSTDAEADRAFIRDILGFLSVDVGGGWLIFRLPKAEAAVHPAEDRFVQSHAGAEMLGAVLYLMCEDLGRTMDALAAKGVRCSPVMEAEWGKATSFALPSGGSLGLYQPFHPLAIERA